MVFNNKEYIAKKIKEYRKRAHLTQAELGEKIGITDKHICKIENGTYAPSVETFLKMIDVLDINISEFGISQQSDFSNPIKASFTELIYSLNEKELEFLYENSKTLLSSLKKYKK